MRASLAQLSTGFIQPFSGRDGQAVLAAKGRNSTGLPQVLKMKSKRGLLRR